MGSLPKAVYDAPQSKLGPFLGVRTQAGPNSE